MTDDDIALVAINHDTRAVNTIARACPECVHELARAGDFLLMRLPGWVDELLDLAYGSPRDRISPAPVVDATGRTSQPT